MKQLFCVLALLALLGAIFFPTFTRARYRTPYGGCKSNLKNIGTAMEMYATDWDEHYPRNLEMLVPKYLKSIPVCVVAGYQTYRLQTGKNCAYNTGSVPFEDYYFVECTGDHHSKAGLPRNYPQYDGIQGLIER